jgi:hypothetical protein
MTVMVTVTVRRIEGVYDTGIQSQTGTAMDGQEKHGRVCGRQVDFTFHKEGLGIALYGMHPG